MPEALAEVPAQPGAVRPADSEEFVRVFNRSSATYKHVLADGKKIVVAPGQDAEVPANVADVWHRVSNRTVNVGSPGPSNNSHELLAAAKLREAELEAKLAALEKRVKDAETAAATAAAKARK